MMLGLGTRLLKGIALHAKGSVAARITGRRRNAKEAIFGQGTRSPFPVGLASEPTPRWMIVRVIRVAERDQDIDVEQVDHSVSSLNRLTISIVTNLPFPLRGKRNVGKPFFILTFLLSRKRVCRARSERTFPAVVFWKLARSFTAERTSSSRSKVVRIT